MKTFITLGVSIIALTLCATHARGQLGVQLLNTTNSNDFVLIPPSGTLEPQNFTIEGWITPQGPGFGSVNDGFGASVFATVGNLGTATFALGWDHIDERIGGSINNQAATVIFSPNNQVMPGMTSHVALTYDGLDLRLYVNGTEVASVSATAALNYGTGSELRIGAFNHPTFLRRFSGIIDEVRLWDHARTPMELQAQSCVITNSMGLRGLWTFNAGNADDSSGNGNHGTFQGNAASVPNSTCSTPNTPYPGSGEDFALFTGIATFPVSGIGIKVANPGDLLTVHFESVGGGFLFEPVLLVGQAFQTGFPPLGPIPSVHIDLALAVFLVNGSILTPLGFSEIIGPGGNTHFYVIPAALSGLSVMLQSAVLTSSANNGFFAVTNGHEIQIL